ncbi:luciferin 4-monooxygenase-like [Tenebrio molitor]
MELKVLEGPPDQSRLPRESPAKLLLRACNTHHDNTALIDIRSGESLTYAQLCQLSKNLAASLRRLGVKKDDIVGVVSENSHKLVVAYLAGLFLAAPLHLINAGFREYELEELLKISRPRIVFCTNQCHERVLKVKRRLEFVEMVISFDDEQNEALAYADLVEESSCFQVEEDVDVDDQVGLIVNSSGTTGLPKGVMITYRMLRMNFVHARDRDFLYMKPNEVVPLVLPFCHSYAVLVMNAILYGGATLAVIDRFKPTTFLETIQKHKAEQLVTVHTLMHFLVNSPLVDQYDLSSVKQVWIGGSKLHEEDAEVLWKRFNLQKLHVIYGMTEIGIPMHISDNRKGGCGRVTCGYRVKVVDRETGLTLPPQHRGEICIGGAVTKGYLNDPQKTEETIDAEGFVHTEDIGYYGSGRLRSSSRRSSSTIRRLKTPRWSVKPGGVHSHYFK